MKFPQRYEHTEELKVEEERLREMCNKREDGEKNLIFDGAGDA